MSLMIEEKEICKYCSGEEQYIKDKVYGGINITISNKVLKIEGETACSWENVDYIQEIDIKYCPFCGKQLD